MNTSIKVIKFTTKAAIVLAAITYLISLNIAFGWFDIKWCSNNFLFTVFGGAFASTLVVLICELQKYQQCKRDTIDLAFNQIGSIYAWLKVMTYNLKKYQDDKNLEVNKEILVGNIASIKQEMDMFLNIDYTTYSSSDISYKKHKDLKEWVLLVFTPFVSECTYFQLAVNTDQIDYLLKHKVEGKITYSSYNTGKVIDKLIRRITDMMLYLEEYLQFIDKYIKNETSWETRKIAIDKIVAIDFAELSDYLKQED